MRSTARAGPWFAAATGSSITAPSSARSTTRLNSPSTRPRPSSTSPTTTPIPVRRRAGFRPGTLLKNNGLVVLDVPNRQQPYAHQMTVGYSRELTRMMAIQADYIHIHNKDMFLGRNLNPMVRANTTRTGAITRTDAFGVLGEAYSQQVWVMENTGESKYDALNFSLEKRYSNN